MPPNRRPGRHRLVLAAVVSILATFALCVPLAYQAYSARDGADGPDGSDRPDVTASTVSTTSTVAPTTETTVPARVLPTTLERPDVDLTWASTIDDPAPRPLEGATIQGSVVVQLLVEPGAVPIRAAEFWVDHIDSEDPPRRVDEVAPFTLGDSESDAAGRFDTNELSDGVHVVVVQATHEDGTTIERTSRFRIDNG